MKDERHGGGKAVLGIAFRRLQGKDIIFNARVPDGNMLSQDDARMGPGAVGEEEKNLHLAVVYRDGLNIVHVLASYQLVREGA